MKKKYNLSITDLLNSTYKVDGWEISDYTDGFSDDGFSSYADFASLINIYYDSKTYVDETEEQKKERLAKEKAVKRNNKIDQILGDDK